MIKKKSYSFSAQPSLDSLKSCVAPQGYTLHACPQGPHGIDSGVDLNQWTWRQPPFPTGITTPALLLVTFF